MTDSSHKKKKTVQRFVPIAPALSSGVKGIIEKDEHIPDPRYQGEPRPLHHHPFVGFSLSLVDRLLNPCRCKSVWECQCNTSSRPSDRGRVETLVRAATWINPVLVSPTSSRFSALAIPSEPPPVRKSCCASKNPPMAVSREDTGPVRGPDLPPLLLDPEQLDPLTRNPPCFATPPSIPPMKSVVLLAGTGCSCGFECACPGCAENRIPSLSAAPPETSRIRSCPDDCPHCVDRLGGVALPEPGPASKRHSFGGIVDPFLSHAANLPPPPKNRSVDIDPTNITVFPVGLFSVDLSGSSDGIRQGKARSAWGLVDIPKLECCGGACGCPDDGCVCRNSCVGCCVEGDDPRGSSDSEVLTEHLSCRANT